MIRLTRPLHALRARLDDFRRFVNADTGAVALDWGLHDTATRRGGAAVAPPPQIAADPA